MKIKTLFLTYLLVSYFSTSTTWAETQAPKKMSEKVEKTIVACIKDDTGALNHIMDIFKIRKHKINYLLFVNEDEDIVRNYNKTHNHGTMSGDGHIYIYDKSLIDIDNAYYDFDNEQTESFNLYQYGHTITDYRFEIFFSEKKNSPRDIIYDYAFDEPLVHYSRAINPECLKHSPKKFMQNFKLR